MQTKQAASASSINILLFALRPLSSQEPPAPYVLIKVVDTTPERGGILTAISVCTLETGLKQDFVQETGRVMQEVESYFTLLQQKYPQANVWVVAPNSTNTLGDLNRMLSQRCKAWIRPVEVP